MSPSRRNIFSWIVRISCSHPRQLIWGTLVLAALSIFLITRLPFQSDVLNLLPGHAPRTGDLVKFLKEFGSADSLFIVLESETGAEVESFVPFADVFMERLMATGEFTDFIGRMDPRVKENLGRLLLRKALLYLDEKDLGKLADHLSDTGIESRIHSLKTRLSSVFVSPLPAYDPLGLFPLFQKNIPLSPLGADLDAGGLLISTDRKMLLLIGKPKGRASDVDYDEILVRKIREAEASTRLEFEGRKDAPPDSLKDLKVGLTGGFIHALEDKRMIKKELLINFSVSLAGIILLVFYAFRSMISLLYGFFPLLVSPLLTLGFLCPFLGRLSEATGAFSAIILGLSIDYFILLYARYREDMAAEGDVFGSLEKSLASVGPGVFTGAVTTTAAYYALLMSDFRGVRELGFLTGSGVLISMISTFFLFPALVAWRERKGPSLRQRRGTASLLRLEKLGLCSLRHSRTTILMCLVLTGILFAFSFRIQLNNDPSRLRPQGNPSVELEKRVQQNMEEGLETVFVLAEGKNPEESLEIQGRWKRIFEEGRSSGIPISRYEVLSDIVPPLSQQKRNLLWIESRGGELDPDRVEKKVREALRREGLRADSFEPGINALREMLANREPLQWENSRTTALKGIEDRFLIQRGDGYLTAAYLHVRPDFWLGQKGRGFLENLQGTVPGTRVTSPRLVQKELEELMSREFWKILLLALAVVSVLIYLDFRSWPLTFICLLPVALGSVWTLGLLALLGIDLNFMNLVVFTMVLGIGVDYSVHIAHRMLASSAGRIGQDLVQVSKGVVLAGLTTLWGFGSLISSSYPGLRSMGVVALMGVGFSLLISLTLTVLLAKWWLQRKG